MNENYLPVPIGDLPASMPSPFDLAKALERSLMEHVFRLRTERGAVTIPSDVFELVRSLTKSHEILKDYENAFSKARRIVQEEIEGELCEAVGDQEGVPNSGLTIPDSEGDVRISVDSPNSYKFDIDQITKVAIAASMNYDTPQGAQPQEAQQYAWNIALEAIGYLLDMGDYRPQVSKVKAMSMNLSRQSDDDLSGALLSSIQKTTAYRGVKFERKESRKK